MHRILPAHDHIHLWFGWAGARGATSFWTGQVADTDYGPCVVFDDRPRPPTERANPEPCPDTRTASAVRTFKSAHGLPDNARVTGAVWSALSA